MDKIYSMTEMRKISGKSRQTLHKWLKMGLLSDNFIGRGKRYFTQKDVDSIPEIIKYMNKNIGRPKHE